MEDLTGLGKATEVIVDKLAEPIYKDLFQPSTRVIGETIGSLLSFCFCWHYTLLAVAKDHELRAYAKRNLELVDGELCKIPEDKLIQPAPEIAVPAMDRLAYIRDEDLALMYAKLIGDSSNRDKIDYVHPTFVGILERISPREAKLLERIERGAGFIVCLKVMPKGFGNDFYNTNYFSTNSMTESYRQGKEARLEDIQIESIGIANLLILGLVKEYENYNIPTKKLESEYNDTIRIMENIIKRDKDENLKRENLALMKFLELYNGPNGVNNHVSIYISELGKSFLSIVGSRS